MQRARNYFADPMQAGEDAFDRAYDRQQAVTDRFTTTRAGRQLAGGDRAGAGRTFAGAGMINEARVLEADGLAEQARARQAEDRAKADQKAAEAEAAAARKAQADAMLAIFGRLQNIPAGQRSATLQRAAPILQSVGLDPAPFLQMPEADLSDEALTMATGEIAKAAEEYTLAPGARRYRGDQMIANNPARPVVMGGGASAFDPETGEVVARNPKTFAPPRAGGGKAAPAGPKPTGRRF